MTDTPALSAADAALVDATVVAIVERAHSLRELCRPEVLVRARREAESDIAPLVTALAEARADAAILPDITKAAMDDADHFRFKCEAVEKAVREWCPTANNIDENGEMLPDAKLFTCQNEDGECIIAADTLDEAVRQMGERWDEIGERLATAARERDAYYDAIEWALGYTDFAPRPEGAGAYWWRSELTRRSGFKPRALPAVLDSGSGK